MPESPEDWIRVKDNDTGHHRSVRRQELPHGNYTQLKQDAVDHVGDPLPPKFADSASVTAAEKAEGVEPSDTPKGK